MTARRRRTTAPDRAVLDGDSPSRRNDGMLSHPHDLRPHFRQSCEAPHRRSPEEDAVFCFDSHRCGLRPPRQAKDFEPGDVAFDFRRDTQANDHDIFNSCRYRPQTQTHRLLAHSAPTEGTKTQPKKQGAGNGIRPPKYKIAGPLGHEIVSRSQKHFTDRRIGNPKRNPPRKQGRSR